MGNNSSVLSRSVAQKRALIFGFDYSGINKLNGPENDARLVQNTLVNSFGFDPANILIITTGDIIGPLTQFIDASLDGDINVIHYSGHGEYVNGTDYLVRSDLSKISSVTISNLLMKAKGDFLVVIDACDSGSIVQLPYVCNSTDNQINKVNNNSFNSEIVNFTATGRTQSSYESRQTDGIIYGDFTFDFYNYLGSNVTSNWISIYDNVYRSVQSIEIPYLNCSDMKLYYQPANTFI